MSFHTNETNDWTPNDEFNDDGLEFFDDEFDYAPDHLDPGSALEMGDLLWEASAAAAHPNYSDS